MSLFGKLIKETEDAGEGIQAGEPVSDPVVIRLRD
jgi:hypothetical protein